GGSPLCAPLVGWAVCKLSWKGAMDYDLSMLSSSLTSPLAQLKHLGPQAVAGINPQDLLMGQQLGGLGAVQVAALLAGGAYLLIRGRLRPHIPMAFLAGTFLTALIYFHIDPAACAAPLFHLLSGGVVLGAFFLATDCSSSPVGHVPMILFGLLAGCLVVVIRVYGVYPDGVPFAILLAELLTPLVDRIRPRPLGVG
ncbi:MAG: RnfABCDGE type electron transport complex subunit D, partial [Desulfovibrionaceae bacterium]|nr:RnfABCDGE type electron transport complex subunit D [Desulfovibrionaceae bacterium]